MGQGLGRVCQEGLCFKKGVAVNCVKCCQEAKENEDRKMNAGFRLYHPEFLYLVCLLSCLMLSHVAFTTHLYQVDHLSWLISRRVLDFLGIGFHNWIYMETCSFVCSEGEGRKGVGTWALGDEEGKER